MSGKLSLEGMEENLYSEEAPFSRLKKYGRRTLAALSVAAAPLFFPLDANAKNTHENEKDMLWRYETSLGNDLIQWRHNNPGKPEPQWIQAKKNIIETLYRHLYPQHNEPHPMPFNFPMGAFEHYHGDSFEYSMAEGFANEYITQLRTWEKSGGGESGSGNLRIKGDELHSRLVALFPPFCRQDQGCYPGSPDSGQYNPQYPDNGYQPESGPQNDFPPQEPIQQDFNPPPRSVIRQPPQPQYIEQKSPNQQEPFDFNIQSDSDGREFLYTILSEYASQGHISINKNIAQYAASEIITRGTNEQRALIRFSTNDTMMGSPGLHLAYNIKPTTREGIREKMDFILGIPKQNKNKEQMKGPPLDIDAGSQEVLEYIKDSLTNNKINSAWECDSLRTEQPMKGGIAFSGGIFKKGVFYQPGCYFLMGNDNETTYVVFYGAGPEKIGVPYDQSLYIINTRAGTAKYVLKNCMENAIKDILFKTD